MFIKIKDPLTQETKYNIVIDDANLDELLFKIGETITHAIEWGVRCALFSSDSDETDSIDKSLKHIKIQEEGE